MANFATIEDVNDLFRALDITEEKKAIKLLEVVSDSLREEAYKVGKDLDKMIEERPSYKSVLKSVTVDIVARALMTSTNNEPMSQFSQSALGYSISGTYLVPGGGLFIKKAELQRLGLRKQKYGVMEIYENPRDRYLIKDKD